MSIQPKLLSTRRVRTGEIRLSYTNVWEPRKADEDEAAKYGTAILIPKNDTATLDLINQAVDKAIAEGVGRFGGKIPPKATLKLPLRDGDAERPDDAAYAGHYFLNANSKSQPQVVKLEGGKAVPITDHAELYSGAYAAVTIEFYAFAGKAKGIAAGLGNILKTRDGEPLSGGATADDDFGDIAPSATAQDFGVGDRGGFGQTNDDESFLG